MSELDVLVPERLDEQGDWERVVREARHRSRRAWTTRAAAVGLLAAAVFAAVLAWPSSGPKGSILDRALAAVGDGPVLHVVMREEWGATLVDLQTGERRRLYGEREAWYDPKRGLHEISRFAGRVQGDIVYEPDELAAHQTKTYAGLASGYRKALESGTAQVVGPGVVDGIPIYWIKVHAELLPDVADGKLHEWAKQVAISRETYEPVYTRETRDGEPGPQTGARILHMESLVEGEGNFTATAANGFPTVGREGSEPIEIDRAAEILGRQPLWLGDEFAGLRLAQISRTETAFGYEQRRRITGATAEAAKRCFEHVRREGVRRGPDCNRMRRARQSLVIRGEAVYVMGKVVSWEEYPGVRFFYGTVGDDPTRYREQQIPEFSRPFVAVTEKTRLPPLSPIPQGYVVPAGSILILGGRSGFLHTRGLYVSIEASSNELILSAARALEPLPG